MASAKTSTLTLRQTVFLTLALMFASVASGAAALYVFQWRIDARVIGRSHALAVADSLAPQVADLIVSGNEPAQKKWLENQLMQTSVMLVGIERPGRPPVFAQSVDDQLRAELIGAFAAGPGAFIRRIETKTDAGEGRTIECIRYSLPATVAGEHAYLMLAVRVPSQHAELRNVLLMFVLPMAGVSITGLVLGYWWLHRYVLGPLDHLSRLARDPTMIDGDGARRSLDRTDQIGGVARALQFLHSDLATWRERVQELENQMDRRIQARTSEMSKALKRIARQVAIDPLTGLYNRRFLDERFDELFDEHRRVGQDLSVVMIDVDNFKLLNDQCGHAAGDDVLRFVAKLLEDSTRATDFAVRYGGDEFCVILTATNAASAEQLAARVVAMFGQNAKMLPVSQKPSLSAGVASIRVHCPDSATQLLQMADAALYACKKNGKSLVRQYESSMQTVLATIV